MQRNPADPADDSRWDYESDEFEEYATFQDPQMTADLLRNARLTNDFRLVRWLLKPILADSKIDVETDTVAFRRFLNIAVQLAIKAFEIGNAEISGKVDTPGLDEMLAAARLKDNPLASLEISQEIRSPEPDAVRSTPSLSATVGQQLRGARPISTYIDTFVAERKKGRTEGTKNQSAVSLSLMVRIIGDRPAGSLKRSDAKTLHETLEKLPDTMGKSSRHDTMSIDEIIASRPEGASTMAKGTLDRHWRNIQQFFEWMNVQDDVPEINMNRVFGGFEWSEHVPGEEDRLLWDEDSISRLINSPIWTGFQPHAEKRDWRHKPGNVVIRDEYWWLPLLGIYHGARLEELCRLRGTDIYPDEVDGIHVMHFHGKRLKNKASRRETPIHSAVIRLGFLDFAKAAGENLLFPLMIEGGRDKKLGFEYSKDFTAYRRRIGIYTKGMDFHAFRHLVTTRLIDDCKSPILIADEITGHDSKLRKEVKENQSESLRYFRGHKVRTLQEEIEKLSYPQIDIDRLASLAAGSEGHAAALAKKWPSTWKKLR
jgi:integrase